MLDLRELVVMTENIEAAHLTEDRRSIRELTRRMKVKKKLLDPEPEGIIIFDDVLTTGAHFKAVEAFLRAELPETPIAGLFLARRAPESGPI